MTEPISVIISAEDADVAIAAVIQNGRSGEIGVGIRGESYGLDGVVGVSHAGSSAGVSAVNDGGGFGLKASGTPAADFEGDIQVSGIIGVSASGEDGSVGVSAVMVNGRAGDAAVGVRGESYGLDGVLGVSHAAGHAGVSAVNDGGGFGLWASGAPAGLFQGDVHITGTLNVDVDIVLANAGDCAEEFAVTDDAQPGTVMVLHEGDRLTASSQPYDSRVAGVVCGAGDFKTGIVLRNSSRQQGPHSRIALMGRVCCLVDATSRPIRTGDLLTTARSPGRAMRATSRRRSRGAVLGKALAPLSSGFGLIPILVSLQ